MRLVAPKLVTPYRMSGKRGKNDAADAAAICEAMQRPNMRFVPMKSEAQQARLCVHRVRRGFVEQRTAAYFSPSWTAFQADRGRDFSVIVDGVSD